MAATAQKQHVHTFRFRHCDDLVRGVAFGGVRYDPRNSVLGCTRLCVAGDRICVCPARVIAGVLFFDWDALGFGVLLMRFRNRLIWNHMWNHMHYDQLGIRKLGEAGCQLQRPPTMIRSIDCYQEFLDHLCPLPFAPGRSLQRPEKCRSVLAKLTGFIRKNSLLQSAAVTLR
jgi:hypothetical protein